MDALEQDMKAVQSKASKKTSARLDELEHALGVTDLRAKRASEMVQLNNVRQLSACIISIANLIYARMTWPLCYRSLTMSKRCSRLRTKRLR